MVAELTQHYRMVTVTETKVKDGLAMVDESVDHFSCGSIPYTDGGVGGSGNDVVLVVLKTQNGACMTCQHLDAFQRVAIPYLRTGHNS